MLQHRKAHFLAQSWLPQKAYSKNHGSQESHLAAPLPDFIVFGNPSEVSTNYADKETFKNMLLIFQVPSQEPHTFTCGINDLSFSWGPLLFFILYFYFLVFQFFL